MGLIKKEGIEVRGVLVKPAYARLINLSYSADQTDSRASFGISTTRENLAKNGFITVQLVECIFDPTADNLLEEAYNQAKIKYFTDWEDDIVTSEEE